MVEIVLFPSNSETCASIAFLLLVSLALNSMASYPHSFATMAAEDDLPIPGGPESKTAFSLVADVLV